jgi:glycosyltransferase involved in cell wall biosynthesis
MKVFHIITSLGKGGAEKSLVRLLESDRSAEHIVVSLKSDDHYAQTLRSIGTTVYFLNFSGLRNSLNSFFLLVSLIKKNRPNVVQTWMYHSDLIGGIATLFSGRPALVWNVRNTVLDPAHTKLSTIAVAKLCALVSFWLPDSIIFCAHTSLNYHRALGYRNSQMTVVPNGFDMTPFNLASGTFREKLGLQKTFVLGMAGRFDPYKDHKGLLHALAKLKHSESAFKCLLVGDGIDESNLVINQLIGELGLSAEIILLGHTNDIPQFMKSLDLYVMSSISEAFPNVLAEAMASGVPCVSTDAGDAREILGDCGILVPHSDPSALAAGIEHMMKLKPEVRRELGEKSKRRIEQNYRIESTVQSYLDVYNNVRRDV